MPIRFNMNSTVQFPFYAKFALVSIGAFAFGYTLYIGQHIILPLIYATILAILLNPLVNFLVLKKMNKILSIFIAVVLTILIVLCFIYFISTQLTILSDTFPLLKEKFYEASKHTIRWTSENFNINMSNINKWIQETENDAINNLGGAIGQTISTLSSILIMVVLLPVYLFMILYYKDLLLEFIRRLFKAEQHIQVFEILNNSKGIIQSYLIGLLVEAAIVAALNSLGLLIIGIEYAIILGITGALLNVIPYIGGVIAIALPMIIAIVTKDSPICFTCTCGISLHTIY
jgi:predicted PurR-regulated permease PerM